MLFNTYPLSQSARYRLGDKRMKLYVVAGVAGFFALNGTFNGASLETISYILLAFGGIGFLLTVPLWLIQRSRILRHNREDYELGEKLNRALAKFESVDASTYPVTGEVVEDMRPYRVEYHMSDSLRGELTGQMSGGGIFSWSGSFSASLRGSVTPNLLDTSNVAFLRNDKGETMRVLLPSPGGIRESLWQAYEWYLEGINYDTPHTKAALDAFCRGVGWRLATITPQAAIIDRIDVACRELAFADRPTVRVVGRSLGDGIMVAGKLSVGDKEGVILPVNLFEEITGSIAGLISPDEPQVYKAIASTR